MQQKIKQILRLVDELDEHLLSLEAAHVKDEGRRLLIQYTRFNLAFCGKYMERTLSGIEEILKIVN
ncbi:MAG: hypothetical protein JRJ12_15540 [Deltaproteobacteria bacterium]|nr:hypothetical protein [Deltaproteobacteria bacterium]